MNDASPLSHSAWPGSLSGPSHLVLPQEDDGPARPLAVFFGARDLVAGRFNFPQSGRDLDAHRIFLNNGGNDWYQTGIPGFGADFEACLAQLRRWQAALGASGLCLVGTSMGGFGALRYGAALGARVLAFASDCRIGAPLSQSAAHYAGPRPPPCPDLCAAVAQAPPGAELTLIAGERDIADLSAAAALQATGRVRVLSVIGAGHYVPMTLSRRGQLTGLLRGFVEQGLTPALPVAGAGATVPDYVAALERGARAAAAQDWAAAERQARRAQATHPFGEAGALLLGQALLRQGRAAEAVEPLSRSLVTAPEDLAGLQLLATALRNAGGLLPALALNERILAQDPGQHGAHYAMALVLEKLGRPEEARAALHRALRGRRHPSYLARLARLDRLLGA